MSAKQSTENKSLESAVKADIEDKATAPADEKAADADKSVTPNSGVEAYPTPGADDNVKFVFAHPVKKSRLDESFRDDEEYAVGEVVQLPADVAESLARVGAGRVGA